MVAVHALEVRTTVARPPGAVFEHVTDFASYPSYTKYLRDVGVRGDGDVGTEYRLHFGWWRLTYDAHTRVTGLDAPNTLDWEVTRDLDARGRWIVDEDGGDRSDVRFRVHYDPTSVSAGAVDLPTLVPLDWVVERVVDLIEEEGRRVVERLVADIEGEARSVDLSIERWRTK